MNKPIRIALLASGNGTNVQQITEYLKEKEGVEVNCVLYNKKDAYVAERARKLGIEAHYFNKHDFMETDDVLNFLKERDVDWLILAGFLLLVPENLLKAYPNRVINIHPALLPKYGGKGMYGHHVHEAVVANHETMSGITIHIVDQHYDRGTILFQAYCKLSPADSADDLAAKIHILEKTYYPKVVEAAVLGYPMPVQKCPID
jgi:phosphoribosylglycinamide formyltransferase-1